MSYDEASNREANAFIELLKAATDRSHLDARTAVFSEHAGPYEAAVERLLAAAQAYEAASLDLLRARHSQVA